MDHKTATDRVSQILHGWELHSVTGVLSIEVKNGVVVSMKSEVVEKFTATSKPPSNGVRFVETR